MDFEDIGSKLANLTMYDVKQFYTQAKNYALNISEIEAKVNEATSNDAWGASSTLMQEIANATHNFQDFNEIMPAIYRKFMEKEARDWRQIYKSLQLLEYLVKHGSERVVDDARSHVSTIKILRNFHYIDEAAKDQGINVRNRAKEIAELLSDVDRIRQERRKARANKNKYQGASNSDFVPGSGGGRYGGFGSDSAYAGNMASGSGGGGSYGDDRRRQESFDEYDAGDYEEGGGGGRSSTSASRNGGGASRRSTAAAAAPPAPKKEEKVADLFSFDDDEPAAPAATSNANNDDFGDDFDDFQGASTTTTSGSIPSVQASKPAATQSRPAAGGDVFDFLGGDSSTSSSNLPQPNRQSSVSSNTSSLQPTRPSVNNSRTNSTTSTTSKPSTTSTSSGLGGFDDLWGSASGSTSNSNNNANKGKMTMAQMAKDKSQSSVWGSGSGTGTGNANQQNAAGSGGQKKDLFDLL